MYMCSIWTMNKSQYLVVWSEYDKNSKYMVNLNNDMNGALLCILTSAGWSTNNKPGLQPVSRPVEQAHYFGGWVKDAGG